MVPFFSHGSNFLSSPLGGDVEEIGNFERRKIRSHGIFFSHGSIFLASPLWGDVEELGNFHERKIRSHGTILLARGETSNAWLEKMHQ